MTYEDAIAKVRRHGGLVSRPNSATLSRSGVTWSTRYNVLMGERGVDFHPTFEDQQATDWIWEDK